MPRHKEFDDEYHRTANKKAKEYYRKHREERLEYARKRHTEIKNYADKHDISFEEARKELVKQKLNKTADLDLDSRFKQLIEEGNRERIQKNVDVLKQNNETLNRALTVSSQLSELDKDRIRHLISKQEEQIAQLKQILEKTK